MTDGWEVQYGLNPLSDDSEEDDDKDGFSNIEEYENDTDPADSKSHPPRPLHWIPLLLESD